jgi:hypothetical protein
MSEALVRFARTSGWSLLRLHGRAPPRTARSRSPVDAHATIWRTPAGVEPKSRTQTGVNELQRLLQRAGTGLRPPQSFAPSRSVHRREHANPHATRARAHSAFQRLKSRSFNGTNWAPL